MSPPVRSRLRRIRPASTTSRFSMKRAWRSARPWRCASGIATHSSCQGPVARSGRRHGVEHQPACWRTTLAAGISSQAMGCASAAWRTSRGQHERLEGLATSVCISSIVGGDLGERAGDKQRHRLRHAVAGDVPGAGRPAQPAISASCTARPLSPSEARCRRRRRTGRPARGLICSGVGGARSCRATPPLAERHGGACCRCVRPAITSRCFLAARPAPCQRQIGLDEVAQLDLGPWQCP